VSDIVERLRQWDGIAPFSHDANDAADEIVRLRAEVQSLARDALGAGCQAWENNTRAVTAEAERDRLRAERDDARYETHVLRISNATLSKDALAAEADRDRLRDALMGVVIEWEALAGGRDYSPREVEQWLIEHMKPAIDGARAALGDKP
jgi:hypothetical protein